MPITVYDTRINRFVALTSEEANGVSICKELMLQAQTFAYDGKNVDSFFALAKVEREKFEEGSAGWNICENTIQYAADTVMLLKV